MSATNPRRPFQSSDPALVPIAEKVLGGERLNFDDGVALYGSSDILAVGWLANSVREKLHGDIAYFNVNRHINPTNVCVASCRLCAFGRKKDSPGAYTMALEEAWETAASGYTEAVTEFHIVGGLHPDLPFEYFLDLVRGLKVRFPLVHVKAFTMVEVAYLAKRAKLSISETLVAMRDAGVDSMPGGGAVAVLHDITRIEQVERTQRDFVANVSHELRTPLTSISGYVETLLDHEASLSPQAREFLTTILKNASRMNRLTEDLLTMARVESSEQELHPGPVPADILVRDAVQAMSGLVQDAEAVLEIGETTTTEVYADTDAILQVLSNLIENGIKYGQARTDLHCRVVVSAHEIFDPIPAVEFRVRDFGQGIASEHLNRIFERFYRVDKARSRESGGTGLGLAIARHVVQTLGGTIRAERELNAGSTFIFTLPLAEQPVK